MKFSISRNDHQYSVSQYILQGAIPYSNAHFGSGSGPIWLDYLYCDGNENSLLNCSHRGIGATALLCDHSDDVGVHCPGIKALLNVSIIPRLFSYCSVFEHLYSMLKQSKTGWWEQLTETG